jgi:Mn-dependent DtxR family transcriptional regulator
MEKKIQHTHDHELSHSMVHYLLTIHKLKELNGYARVTDIARDLQITKGSVSTAINNLKKRELVIEDAAKFLALSESGHAEVHRILSSRTLLFYFLKDIVGVDDEVAHKDSCLMEHLLSDETREKFFMYLKNHPINSDPGASMSIDLSKYNCLSEFLRDQKGDSYLKSN